MPTHLKKAVLRQHDKNMERHATWLEIFFDLVFAVIVTQLSNRLSAHMNLDGIAGCAFLFLPLMWTWASYTVFAARFDNNDPLHWLLTLVIMFAAIIMAVRIPDALENGSTGFTAGFLTGQTVLILLYLHVEADRQTVSQISRFYLAGFGFATLVWLISLFMSPPFRYFSWAAGMSIYLIIPWIGRQKILSEAPLDPDYIPERFGSFTIIILGQMIASVVFGLENTDWNFFSALSGLFAFILATAVFAQYYRFNRIADYTCTLGSGQPYIYTHIPLIFSLIMMGTCVEAFIKNPAKVHMPSAMILFAATLIWLLSFTLLQYISIRPFRIRALISFSGIIALLLAFIIHAFPAFIILGFLDLIFFALFALQYRAGKHHMSVHRHHKKIN